MARTNATNFSGGLQFPYATAATDIFKKEDVQVLAQAVDQHDHTAGKGLSVAPANASITNAKLASDTARANLLTNGGFEIWQRGNGPFTATAAYCADRWQIALSGGDTVSVSRSAGESPGQYAAGVTITHSAGNVLLQQVIKTSETQLLGKAVAFSIRVWSNVAGPVVILSRDGTGGGQATGTAHTGGSAWQTLTVTAAIPGDATQITLAIVFSASGSAIVDNAMLVVGSQPADYAPLHPADDLARCLRYYEIHGAFAGALIRQWVAVAGAATDTLWVSNRVFKAVTPTITKSGTWTVNLTSGQPGIGGQSTQGYYLTCTGNTANSNPYYQCADATCSLLIEANP